MRPSAPRQFWYCPICAAAPTIQHSATCLYVGVVCNVCVSHKPACCLPAPLLGMPAAAYDQAVMALMADPEAAEDLFSVMSAGEGLTNCHEDTQTCQL